VRGRSKEVAGWGRRRLLMILAAVALMILSFVFGLIMVVQNAATRVWRADGTGGDPAVTDRQHRPRPASRDAIAAEPMLEVQLADSRPTAPAPVGGPVMQIPPSTVSGPAGVPTGFPPTAEGAVGQLAAIEVTVLQGMSIPHTNDVYRRWALPGGVGVERWQMTANVQTFLAAAQMGQEKDLSASVVALPAAGQIKGIDGPDWLVACVLLEIRATITVEARMGYGYCERMQWQNRRWMIAPGTLPAKAPSTWPGSELSIKAGWRSWIDAGEG
jgi:hypothetical protein